jgi:hypothetical protein
MEFINPCDDISLLPYNNETEISGKRLAAIPLSALQPSLEMSRPTGETEAAASSKQNREEDDDEGVVVGSANNKYD